MKKIITLFLFIIIAQCGFSQITITQQNLLTPGSLSFIYADYIDTTFLVTAPSATTQLWDYSKLFNIDDTSTIYYQSPTETPYSSLFPDATFGENETTYDLFYKSDSTGFYYVGAHYSPLTVQNYDTLQTWNPEVLLMPAPFSYGNTRSYTAKSVVTGYDDSLGQYVRAVDYKVGEFTADAFGSLVTPAYSFTNVLRVKNAQLEYDTTYSSSTQNGTYTVFDTSSYNYLNYYFVPTIGYGFYLAMEIDLDGNTKELNGAYYYYTVVPDGISKMPAKSPVFTNVFPNPSHASALTFTFDNAQAHELKIYNMVVECMETENIDGVNSLTISNKLLISGLYFYQVIDNAGQVLDGKKFVVQ